MDYIRNFSFGNWFAVNSNRNQDWQLPHNFVFWLNWAHPVVLWMALDSVVWCCIVVAAWNSVYFGAGMRPFVATNDAFDFGAAIDWHYWLAAYINIKCYVWWRTICLLWFYSISCTSYFGSKCIIRRWPNAMRFICQVVFKWWARNRFVLHRIRFTMH